MSKMSAQSLRMSIVNAAVEDDDFRAALETNAQAAVESRFGKTDLKLNIQFEKEGELPILIPAHTERLEKALAQVIADLGDRSPTRGEFEALVIHRAWTDEAFSKSLDKDARSAIVQTLGAYSASLPNDVEVKLHREQEGECTVVVPLALDMSELSEAELESVSGGDITIGGVIVGAVAGAIAGKVVDVVWDAATEGPAPAEGQDKGISEK